MNRRSAAVKPAGQVSGGKIMAFLSRPSRTELFNRGEKLRTKCARRSHAVWKPPKNRSAPLSLIKQSDKGRLSELVPIRHGRNC